MFRNLLKTTRILFASDFAQTINHHNNNSGPTLMTKRYAGHSKWQNIRHIKASKDAQRSTLFLRLSKQMKVAIQEGNSSNPDDNLKLRNVVDQAKRASMPQATIQSIIRSSQADKSNCKSHLLEIKGPGSCIILCDVFTNNIHHLKQTVASIIKKHGSKYTDGGGIHLFEEKGVIETRVLAEDRAKTPNELIEAATDHAIESGAEEVDLLNRDDPDTGNYRLEFVCGASNLKNVVGSLEKLHYQIDSASVEYIPIRLQELNENEQKSCATLYDKLESLPEVVRISDNIAL